MGKTQKTILIRHTQEIEKLLEVHKIFYEIENFLVLPEPIFEKNKQTPGDKN